jgi:hypothetical protein
MSVWDITENDLQKSLFLQYGQKRSSFKKFIGRVYLNLLYCFEKDRKKQMRIPKRTVGLHDFWGFQ